MDIRFYNQTQLFDALFTRRISRTYAAAQAALPPDQQLRLRLVIQPPELSVLPWELIYDPDYRLYLASRHSSPLIRYLETGRAFEAVSLEGPLRLLYASANPLDTPALKLDESLANFSTVYYYEHAYSRSRADLAFESFVERRYRQMKDAGRDGVVYQPVEAFSPQDYGPIVYGKGAVFFYQLRESLGDAVLLDVLQAYFQDRKYKLATPDDFLRVTEEVSGLELDGFYEEWILSAE